MKIYVIEGPKTLIGNDEFFVRMNEEKEQQRKYWAEQKEENDHKEFERLKNKFGE
jgi:hypothetical protein